MSQLNRDLGELLPANTIISGPFGPAMTIDNRLKGVFDFFGPRPGSREFVKKYNITHIGIAPDRWPWAQTYFKLSENSPLLFNKTIRGAPIQLRRVVPLSAGYYSPYDSLLTAFYTNDIVTARKIAEQMTKEYPDNLVLNQFLPFVYYMSRDLDGTMDIVDNLSINYPSNYDVQRNCAYIGAKCYWASKSKLILEKVKLYLKRSNELDPPERENIEELLRETKP